MSEEAYRISVNVAQLEAFGEQMARATELWQPHAENAMDGSLDLILDWIVANTPVNLGLLRGSFAKDIYGQEADLHGEVVTPLLYGWPVEIGQEPGKVRNVAAIKLWAKRKLGLSGKQLDSAAWAIAIAIGKKGTDGALMVEQAFQRARNGSELDAIWGYEIEQFLKELAK